MAKQGDNDISWADFTFNLWEGCSKISPGCRSCYAEAMNKWLRKGENWGIDAPRKFFKESHYRKPDDWNGQAIREGRQMRVFCGSVMDIAEIHPSSFVNALMNERRQWFFEHIPQWSHLDFLLLSKRPQNFIELLPDWWLNGPPPNVILGATVEDHEHALERYAVLMNTPARRHFFSYEPALGPIDWPYLFEAFNRNRLPAQIIFGDESGRQKRPAELAWARMTRDACQRYGVAFQFKQWCGADADGLSGARDKKGKIHLPVLDGVQHAAFPKEI